MSLRHFLIVFDSRRQKLLAARDLGEDREGALVAYSQCEEHYGMRGDVQIVLVGAESLETVQRTHSQYFTASADDPFAELVV